MRLTRHIPHPINSDSEVIPTKSLWAMRRDLSQRGFALPLAIGMGLVLTVIAVTTIIVAQNDRSIAIQRRESGSGLFVAEGGIARILAQFQKPNNALLMVRNFDTINSSTHKTYLGPDGVPNSGDEENAAVDQWTGYDLSSHACFQAKGVGAPNFVKTGSIGTNATYSLKAYRYDPASSLGTVIVEGIYKGQSSFVSVVFKVEPVIDDFPGIIVGRSYLSIKAVALILRGRQILGSKGNVYYEPSSSADSGQGGISKPGDTTREGHLNALWSSHDHDGANGDTVSGGIFGCNVMSDIPYRGTGTNLGILNASQTLSGIKGANPTVFQVNQIDLANSDTLTVDTTEGPVQLEITDKGNPGSMPEAGIRLRNSAKIVNIRRDGQPPKVGDLRIIIRGNSLTTLYDQTCIQNAFLYSFQDEVRLFTSGPGCAGGRNTNFEGVAWAEYIISSKNSSSNRSITNYAASSNSEFDTLITPGATSGIAITEDLSSLMDLVSNLDWPVRYRIGQIKTWQRLRL